MTTQYINLKGSVKWAKVYEPDVAFGTETYNLNFFPLDGAEWEKFQKTGLQMGVKDDPDGAGKFIKLRRPRKKTIGDDLIFFSPPEISGKVQVSYVDSEGNKKRQFLKHEGEPTRVVAEGSLNDKGYPVDIGNGSLVVVNVSYYDTAKGKGHRLESINVLDLVEYQKSSDGGTPPSEETKKEIKKVSKEHVIDETLNDDMPW